MGPHWTENLSTSPGLNGALTAGRVSGAVGRTMPAPSSVVSVGAIALSGGAPPVATTAHTSSATAAAREGQVRGGGNPAALLEWGVLVIPPNLRILGAPIPADPGSASMTSSQPPLK